MKKKGMPFIRIHGINLINTLLLVIAISLLIIDIAEIRDQNKLIKENNEVLVNSIQEINKNISSIQESQARNTESINLIKKELLSGINKLCSLDGLSIKNAFYRNDTLKVLISNANNQKIRGFLFRFYNEGFSEINSNETLEEFEIKEYIFKIEKPDSIGITPKMLVDNATILCNKELKSDVKLSFNLTGIFNATAYLKAAGSEKNLSMMIKAIQEKDIVTGEVRVLNTTGSYGKPFTVKGNVNQNIITLSAKDITISEGWFEGINKELFADISFYGIIKNDNLIEGVNQGDAKITIKDFPIPGLSITAEGTIVAVRI